MRLEHENTVMRNVLFLGMGPGYSYDCDVNFAEPLAQFTRVVNYDFYRRHREAGAATVNREILSIVERDRPEYVLLHTFRHEVFKYTLARIRARGIPTLLWFSDDHWRFDDYSRHFAEAMSYAVTTDHQAVARYERLGIPAILSQWASNPKYYRPLDVAPDIDVSFVGARTGPRERLVQALADQGIRVRTFGADWPEGRLTFEDMVRVFSRSRINLNSSSSYFGHGHEYPQIKGRVFEIPMSGGLLLTDYVCGLEQYFRLGEEVLCYRSVADAAGQIRYYLAHDDERVRVARAGYERSLRDHTWETRLRALFEEVDRREAARRAAGRGRAGSVPAPGPSRDVPLSPGRRLRVLEVTVNQQGTLSFHASVTPGLAVSAADLPDQLVVVAPDEPAVRSAARTAQSVDLESLGGPFDVMLLTNSVDYLGAADVDRLLAAGRARLTPDGLVLGMMKLWYATSDDARAVHRHRDFRELHRPSDILGLLRRRIGSARLAEVHRPLGPLGPFVVFVASPGPRRLRAPDIAGLQAAIRQAGAAFTGRALEHLLLWSALHHVNHRRREALACAGRALAVAPWSAPAWKALVRATAGRSLWTALGRGGGGEAAASGHPREVGSR